MSISGIGEVASLIEDGINKIWPDKTEQQKAEAAMLMAKLQGALEVQKAQLQVNAVEAANKSQFVSGWRPFIGWVCGAAFAWCYILQPGLSWIMAYLGHPVVTPDVDLSAMYPVLLGMLGLGGLRSFERVKGVSTKSRGQG